MKKSTAEKIKKLAMNYDQYTQYIDDYNQMKSAERTNEKIIADIQELTGKENPWLMIDKIIAKPDKAFQYIAEFTGEEIKEDKKVWTPEEIKELVQTNDKVLYGALKNLYACQTEDEKACKDAKEYNGMGFNGIDAPILTSFAQFLEKTGFLTPKQKMIARKKLVKYNKQLTRLANA